MGQRPDEIDRRQLDIGSDDRDMVTRQDVGGATVYSDQSGRSDIDQTRTELGATATYADPNDPDAIEADIEHTRADMSETIDAIQERLSPQRLAQEAKDTVYDATVGRASQTAKGAGGSMVDTIKHHPVAAAIAGLSIGYLVMQRSGGSSSSQSHSTTGSAQERAGQMAHQARERAGQYGREAREQAQHYSDQARRQAQATRSWAQDRLHENPLAVGAAAMALGAVVGLAVPETRKEHQLMGETRDSLLHRAQETAQDTLQRAQRVAEEAKDTAKQEAKKEGLTR